MIARSYRIGENANIVLVKRAHDMRREQRERRTKPKQPLGKPRIGPFKRSRALVAVDVTHHLRDFAQAVFGGHEVARVIGAIVIVEVFPRVVELGHEMADEGTYLPADEPENA